MTAYGVLVKPASGLCNMHCDYCFYCDEQARRKTAFYGMMRETTLKNVIKRTLMRSEGAYTLAFQGGEPTLRGIPFFRKAVDICSHYNKNHCRLQFAFQTNGYAIDEEWAAFFHDNQFLVGLSVDGTGELHDRHRHAADGGSSFTHVLRAAELFDRFGVDYNEFGNTLDVVEHTSKLLVEAGADVLNVSMGMGGGDRMKLTDEDVFSDAAAIAKKSVDVPVYAIGGINMDPEKIQAVMDCGADAACVMSGLMNI